MCSLKSVCIVKGKQKSWLLAQHLMKPLAQSKIGGSALCHRNESWRFHSAWLCCVSAFNVADVLWDHRIPWRMHCRSLLKIRILLSVPAILISIHLFTHLFVHPSLHLSIYPSIYASTLPSLCPLSPSLSPLPLLRVLTGADTRKGSLLRTCTDSEGPLGPQELWELRR